MDGHEFFKTKIYICHHSLVFSCSIFLSIALRESRCMSISKPSLSPCNSFFYVIYQFALSVMSFLFPDFTPKLFCFLCIQLLVCFSCILLQLHYFGRSYFVCVVWPCSSIFRVFLLSLILFYLFCQDLLSDLSTVFFSSFYPNIWLCVFFFFLSTFLCCHSFFICSSSLISYPSFVFLFVFPWGILIL